VNVERQIAMRLKSRRRLLGLTLQQVGQASGMSYQSIQKYEAGLTRVSAANLWFLAQALRVEPNYFFDGLDQVAGRSPGLSADAP
jgi:transcriptional regulator with XRE-family HTH domain